MKEKILELRRQGLSYKKIRKTLNCSLSTISYHCCKSDLNEPLKRDTKTPDEVINKLIQEKPATTIKKLSKKYNLSNSTIQKYTSRITSNEIRYCDNCGKELIITQNKFCSPLCHNTFKTKRKYEYYLNNEEEFCTVSYSPRYLKKHILIEQNYQCSICHNDNVWNGKEIIFIADHIDGDASNNRRKNLRLICPNCDSQLETYKSKNKNSARKERYLLLKH
jgi:predicted transcriptional regulator